jgi:hypothetical protein
MLQALVQSPALKKKKKKKVGGGGEGRWEGKKKL